MRRFRRLNVIAYAWHQWHCIAEQRFDWDFGSIQAIEVYFPLKAE